MKDGADIADAVQAPADAGDAPVVPAELLPQKRPVGRPRGQDKTGGRRRDMINMHELSPNATPRQLRTHVSKVCAAHKFEPISVLCKIGSNKQTEDKLRVTCASEVASFLYPKLRSVEMTGPDGEALNTGFLDGLDKTTLEALIFVLQQQEADRLKVVENVTDAEIAPADTANAVVMLRPPGWRS
jgi:hypothetical protein